MRFITLGFFLEDALPTATSISVAETIDLFDGPLSNFSEGFQSGRYALWLGSGISRERVVGLDGVLVKLLENLRLRISGADCAHHRALESILGLADLSEDERAQIDLCQPVASWPIHEELINRLWGKYSKVLGTEVDGRPFDYLLWDVLDFPATFAAQKADAEHLSIAMLVLEGAVSDLATANWDGLLEAAMVELGRPNETFRVAVTGDDLRGPPGIGTLYKFHGCANRAIENEADYRPLLVAREADITHWAQKQPYTPMRHQLRALIARSRTLMIGLSGQDTNIQQLFGANGWAWNSVPVPIIFSAQELSEGQKSILEGAYQGEYEANRGQIRADATLPAYGNLRQRHSAIASIWSKLESLQGDAAHGHSLFVRLDSARRNVAATRRAGLQSASLLPEINAAVERATGQPTTNFSDLREALEAATAALSGRLRSVQETLSSRVTIETELEQYAREAQVLSDRIARTTEIEGRLETMKWAISSIGAVRERAKTIATAATHVRSGIVRDVFSGSLNKVWRDLFVRLAPNEQFVPQFRLPDRGDGKVEAVLETFHRSGQASGPPGAMLSQGNLNTAALTLFLALNLSVPSQLPWLVLDDPVQSMDDVHIAQFAALLRTFSKGLSKQVVIAVHERALFEYLTLELSPAFAGDSLITVEISRNFAGDAVADPHFYVFEDDKAVAA